MGSFCVSLRIAEKYSLQGPAAVMIDNLVSSSEQLFHDARFLLDSRQALIEPLKSIGELGMIETEEMQDRRMQITNVNTVLDHVEAEVVRSAKSHARSHSSTGKPDGEGVWMMIATIATTALHHGRASEFAAPDDKGVVEQPTLLEILDETGSGLVGGLTIGL